MLLLISFIITMPAHKYEISYEVNPSNIKRTRDIKYEILQATNGREAHKTFYEKNKIAIQDRKMIILQIRCLDEFKPTCWEVEFKLNNQKKREVVEEELRSECAIFLREKYKGESVEILMYNQILEDGRFKSYKPNVPLRVIAPDNAGPKKVGPFVRKHQSGCEYVIKYEVLDKPREITIWAEDDNDMRAMFKKKVNLAHNFYVVKSCTRIY